MGAGVASPCMGWERKWIMPFVCMWREAGFYRPMIPEVARPLVVLGHKAWMELFAGADPLSNTIRIGDISLPGYRSNGIQRSASWF